MCAGGQRGSVQQDFTWQTHACVITKLLTNQWQSFLDRPPRSRELLSLSLDITSDKFILEAYSHKHFAKRQAPDCTLGLIG